SGADRDGSRLCRHQYSWRGCRGSADRPPLAYRDLQQHRSGPGRTSPRPVSGSVVGLPSRRAVRPRSAKHARTVVRQLATRPPLQRLRWAVTLLRSGKQLKATDLAREFEVNVRTAYRDLDFLRDQWNVPLEFDRAQGTYRLTEPMADLPAVTLSQGELVAL